MSPESTTNENSKEYITVTITVRFEKDGISNSDVDVGGDTDYRIKDYEFSDAVNVIKDVIGRKVPWAR